MPPVHLSSLQTPVRIGLTDSRTVAALFVTLALVLLAPVVLGGCADTDFEPGDRRPAGQVDEDEDGFFTGEGLFDSKDCDDADPTVHPEADEQINCLDDNCDGRVDEGTDNADLDNDGFCPSNGDIVSYGCEGNVLRNPNVSEDGGSGTQEPNGIDDNCNGIVDEGLPLSDIDDDKFTVADGDCNDNDPFVNPGAIEVVGIGCAADADCPSRTACVEGYCRCAAKGDCSSRDACIHDDQCENGETCDGKVCRSKWVCVDAPEGLPAGDQKICSDGSDNDCDGAVDELPKACDTLAELDPTTPRHFAKAMELCDTDRPCGLDSPCPASLECVEGRCSRLIHAEFNAESDARSRTIADVLAKAKSDLGRPRMNESFVILSSGYAVYDPYNLADPEQCPQGGKAFTNVGADPDPNAPSNEANDLSELKLEILVPSNARSFSFDFHFLTTEYPDFLATAYNDTFWVHLDSKNIKGNISFDSKGIPIRLNNAFFEVCDPDPAHPQTQKSCARPASELEGTGYWTECFKGFAPGGGTQSAGGSTGWLTTTAPVEPGERITLTFSIFDKGDHVLDSHVLIDNFRWKLDPADGPTTGPE